VPEQWEAPPLLESQGRMTSALVCSILGLFLSLCCWPVAIPLAAIGIAFARGHQKEAERYGFEPDSRTIPTMILACLALILALGNMLFSIYLQVTRPDLLDSMLKQLLSK
jgi:hypothetical protein